MEAAPPSFGTNTDLLSSWKNTKHIWDTSGLGAPFSSPSPLLDEASHPFGEALGCCSGMLAELSSSPNKVTVSRSGYAVEWWMRV